MPLDLIFTGDRPHVLYMAVIFDIMIFNPISTLKCEIKGNISV